MSVHLARWELFGMAIDSLLRRSGARLLPLTLALAALHCSDEATILVIDDETAPPDGSGSTGGAAPDDDGVGQDPNPDDGGPNGNGNTGGGAPSGGASNGGGSGGEAPDPGPPGACQPRASAGPYWLTEGGQVSITVECGTGASLPGEVFELASLPPNASFDAASRTITFAPALDQAGVYTIGVGISGTTDRGEVEVQVADAFDVAGNVPVNPATYTEEFGVPVLHLGTDPSINADEYLPASITYRGHTFEGAAAKYRGQTSLRYAQKSFTLKFAKEDRFGETISVPGFIDKRKVTLTTTFDDNSYLRARLSFELWNRIGVDHIQVQSYSAVVYLNGEFWGLYTITDHVDQHLMEDSNLFEDGNLYKARSHDANFRLVRSEEPLGPKLSLSEGYTKEEGTPLADEPGANADLEDLVSWVASSSQNAFLAELDSRIVRREYEDWWLLVSLIIAGDSVGKNSYHYRDARVGALDARFHVVPWDFNDSFGQSYLTFREGREATRDPEELLDYNLLFERLLAEPTTREPLIARFQQVLANEWEVGSVLQSFDGWAAEIAGAAARNERKWNPDFTAHFGEFRPSFTTHDEEVAFVRQWIADRWSYVSDYY
jgi:CotH protein